MTLAIALLSSCASPNPQIPIGQAAYDVVQASEGDGTVKEYRIGALDTLAISIFQEPDLAPQSIVVDASGNILLPLVGSVRAAGLTSVELSTAIAGLLRRYLVSPQVTVSIVTAVSQKVTVEGSVEQPGVYAIQGRTTLLDALAMAHGTSRVAALDEVIIFRQINGQPAAARFDVSRIRLGYEKNPEILGSDTVVVGFSSIKGVYRDIIASSSLFSTFTYVLTR